jgi:hypothetical protein
VWAAAAVGLLGAYLLFDLGRVWWAWRLGFRRLVGVSHRVQKAARAGN